MKFNKNNQKQSATLFSHETLEEIYLNLEWEDILGDDEFEVKMLLVMNNPI
jgi:hypothetical protein